MLIYSAKLAIASAIVPARQPTLTPEVRLATCKTAHMGAEI
jgi:hypothetical protein